MISSNLPSNKTDGIHINVIVVEHNTRTNILKCKNTWNNIISQW